MISELVAGSTVIEAVGLSLFPLLPPPDPVDEPFCKYDCKICATSDATAYFNATIDGCTLVSAVALS